MADGNNAAMREALVKAKKAICHHAEHVCQSLSWENSDIQSNCAVVLCAHRDLCEAKTAINAALAKPPRNCDMGTAEEQIKRIRRLCKKYRDEIGKCKGCPVHGVFPKDCALIWAQMPYEEGDDHA